MWHIKGVSTTVGKDYAIYFMLDTSYMPALILMDHEYCTLQQRIQEVYTVWFYSLTDGRLK